MNNTKTVIILFLCCCSYASKTPIRENRLYACRDGRVSFSSPVFPSSLKPEYIVAGFQLCFYSAPALRQAPEGNFK